MNVTSVMRHQATRLELAADAFPNKRDEYRDAARRLRDARVAVAELIEAAEHAALWIEDSALPAMEDSDGGNSLLVGLRAALARAQGGAAGAEDDANHRLIAAAPELLEACLLARHICEDGNALQQQIDAAIAKATGAAA